jgi:hypothetical protein
MGSSIAPPYAGLLNNSTTVTPFFSPSPPSYILFTSNGQLKAETAFGYDLGQDFQFDHASSLVSWDIYRTTLYGQFFTSVALNGTFNDGINGTHPLFVNTFVNLSNARYDGLDVTFRHAPSVGLRYTIQGSLMHSYPYNLPPGFYDQPGAPMSANLWVIPGVNFSAYQYGAGDAPYSQGYAELGYQVTNGTYASLGETYYGPHNGFERPAFFVGNFTLRLPVRDSTLQFSVYNLFNAYTGVLNDNNQGVPGILVNHQIIFTPGGNLGPRTLRVIWSKSFGRS